LYAPARVNNSKDVDKSGNNGVINTDNKDNINADKPNVSKQSSVQSKTNTININAKRAKFEEDIKKDPILKTIVDKFDGELL